MENKFQTYFSKKESLARLVISYLLLFILGIFIVSILEAWLAKYSSLRFYPRSGFSLAEFITSVPNLLVVTGYGGGFLYLIPLIIGFVLVFFAIRAKFFSVILLVILLFLSILAGILSFWAASQPCEGLGCIGTSIMRLAADMIWIVTFATIPILLRKLVKFDRKSYAFLLTAMILILLVGWVVSSIPVVNILAQQISSERERISQIDKFYSNPSFTIFQPAYLPPPIGSLREEILGDRVKTLEWYYNTTLSSAREGFTITQSNIKDFTYVFTRSTKNMPIYQIDELPEVIKKRYSDASQFELMNIKEGIPALYYRTYFGELLIFDRGDTRIKISVFNRESFRDELIKIAESMQVKSDSK